MSSKDLKVKKFKLVPIDDDEVSLETNLETMVNQSDMSGVYKQRGLIIARRLDGMVLVDPSGNLIYEDGTRGSNFLTLVHGIVEPVDASRTRDWDFLKFLNLLQEIGVPLSVYGEGVLNRGDVLQKKSDIQTNWKTVF